MKKEEKLWVGYGFDIDSIIRTRKENKCQVNINYYCEGTSETASFTYEFNNKGIFKNLAKFKEIEKKFKDNRICKTIGFLINYSRYGYMHYFDNEEFDEDILDDIPNSLILNNEAMRELLVNLNPGNKHLIVYVGEYIKDRRKRIEKEKQAYMEENKEIFDKYDQLKEEFNL